MYWQYIKPHNFLQLIYIYVNEFSKYYDLQKLTYFNYNKILNMVMIIWCNSMYYIVKYKIII